MNTTVSMVGEAYFLSIPDDLAAQTTSLIEYADLVTSGVDVEALLESSRVTFQYPPHLQHLISAPTAHRESAIAEEGVAIAGVASVAVGAVILDRSASDQNRADERKGNGLLARIRTSRRGWIKGAVALAGVAAFGVIPVKSVSAACASGMCIRQCSGCSQYQGGCFTCGPAGCSARSCFNMYRDYFGQIYTGNSNCYYCTTEVWGVGCCGT